MVVDLIIASFIKEFLCIGALVVLLIVFWLLSLLFWGSDELNIRY